MLSTYGAGRCYAVRTDITPATPLEFGLLQNISFDLGFKTTPIFGSNLFAVFIARGQASFKGKAEIGIISGNLFQNLFFGQNISAGQIAMAAAEAQTVPAATTYTVTATNGATFYTDYGVYYTSGANAGIPFQKVAASPTQGQYSVNPATGVYTFAAADASAAVAISYTYTVTGSGQKIAITQQLAGTTPFFSLVCRNRDPRSGLFDTLMLNRVTSSKLSLATKNDNYRMPSFEFEAMDDGTGAIGYYSFGDAA